ncbi:uncharacterized protein Z519_06962 [Cladophialophora bantiana CBS 173.52]|uniref:Uncharacterized protein n=1 Tax=Cladophialophora bantiana (strain ATCC 10958 / CBS 173.52 / CDC B-1940 / NIH 8579) TaxID=1442370 RepID=A0A0D2HMI1_CLAB1|nr:uncharacterized protein Z519_06962 [Cladophialophora bantiana CBS 173.52]KIW91980.1 hypothetical protein Z519_06962 [Cladophialophora bantiana CBS 173.52]
MGPGIDSEAQRLANVQQKQKLLEELNLITTSDARAAGRGGIQGRKESPKERRRPRSVRPGTALKMPSRTSARIAAVKTLASSSYSGSERDVEMVIDIPVSGSSSRRRIRDRSTRRPQLPRHQTTQPETTSISQPVSPSLPTDLPSLLEYYNSWTPSAPPPTLDPETQAYHFPSHPHFRPNKSPLSILLEGAFGGTFFSPWRSRTLSLTLIDDHLRTLPSSWLAELQPPEKYITSPQYNAELNRHGKACGQTLAQWEQAGWINFRHDPRGWFEWYVRFWLGRRLNNGEDERQVARWLRCVGPKGRWKTMLLKKYVEMGVHSVFDDGGDDDVVDEDDKQERKVSPVMHQTCLHWGYQVGQADLDDAWRARRGEAG